MIEVAVFLAAALAVGAAGVRLGMILAGRIDRHLAAADAEPPGQIGEDQL